MEELSAANSGFAFKLYKELAKSNASKNIFFCPWSISSALGMVYQGARDNTAAQMGEVLLFNKVGRSASSPVRSPGRSHEQACSGMEQQVQKAHYQIPVLKAHHDDPRNILAPYQALSSEINKPSANYTLASASNMYVEATYPIKKEYVKDIKKYYGVEPQSVNFAAEAEHAREEINSWVESKTKNKIQNLLPEGALNSASVMVLVNAVYFKGDWANKFSKESTEEKSFRLSKTSSKPVEMMIKKAKFNIGRAELPGVAFKVLELPYVNEDLSMIILLPDDITDDSTGLEKLEHALTYEKFTEWTGSENMENINVEVFLPKFKLEESYDLRRTLSSMGMSDAFSHGKADLSGMSDKNDLHVSKVFHKAFVEVNEEGTEAAAATAAVISVRMAPVSVQFNADHPFLFFIRYNNTNTILFNGRFCTP